MSLHNIHYSTSTFNNYSLSIHGYNQCCTEWCMHLTSNLICNVVRTINQYQGNSLSVSAWHSHLGKLGSKCQGHPVAQDNLPPTVTSLSLKGVPNRVTHPLVHVFLHIRNYKYLLTKFILFPVWYEAWNMDTIKYNGHGWIKAPKHPFRNA